MIGKEANRNFLLILTLAGLCIAILSALEGRVEWLSAFCGFFGEGCRETETFTLLRVPVSLWGVGYYVCLALVILFARPWMFWTVMAGFGVEMSFVWIMLSMRLVCLFCLLNFLVMALLFAFSFDKGRVWQTLSVCLLFFVLSNDLLSIENLSQKGVATADLQDPSIAAKVNGRIITAEELETPLAGRIYRLQNEIHALKQSRLNEIIDGMLLQKEADRRGMTRQQLTDSILAEKQVIPTDEEVESYYRQNRNRLVNWKGTQEALRGEIRRYLQGEKTKKAIQEYAKSLREQNEVAIFLKEPPLPLTRVSLGNSPFLGPADASVTVVEFSDYLCPACRTAHETVKGVKEAYQGKIRWVFKDFPLDRHPGAKEMAEAARCAGEQGKFWEFQDLLFAAKEKPALNELKEFANQLGLDAGRLAQCIESGKFRSEVEKDIQSAKDAGVDSTPTFIVNGRLRTGAPSLEDFKELIDEALEKAAVRIQ
jgi:protein-disulfide isomerase